MTLGFRRPAGAHVDAAVKKLKTLYRQFAETYGERLFDLRGFEERYREALLHKIDLASFIRAEIAVFESLRKKVGPQKPPRTEPAEELSYSDIADRIIESNLNRVRKYRFIDFHPDAEEESKYLLGAVTDFYYDCWNEIRKLLQPFNLRSVNERMDGLEEDFCYFVVPVRGQYSRAVEDYTLVLGRKNVPDNERASYRFIKNGGLLLNDCLRLVRDGINFFSASPAHRSQEKSLDEHRDRLYRLIEDFRLMDIRGY
jgi:hypothetical protein